MRATEGRLVGREFELAELEWRLDGLRAAGAQVLALSGEPGIGKTRLLAELAARARARGHLVLAGRALEFESEVPFAPVIDALDAHLAEEDARRLARLDAEQLAELAGVFPALAGRPGAAQPALVAERYRLHRAVRGCCRRSRRGARRCSCSTICTGPTRPHSSLCRTCCGAHPRADC